jgi:hypothetical protein
MGFILEQLQWQILAGACQYSCESCKQECDQLSNHCIVSYVVLMCTFCAGFTVTPLVAEEHGGSDTDSSDDDLNDNAQNIDEYEGTVITLIYLVLHLNPRLLFFLQIFHIFKWIGFILQVKSFFLHFSLFILMPMLW